MVMTGGWQIIVLPAWFGKRAHVPNLTMWGVSHTAQQGGKLRVHWVYRNTRLTTFDANYVLVQNVHRTTAADHRSVVWNRFPKPQYPPWTPRWPINLFSAGVCGSLTTCRSCSLVWDRPTTVQKYIANRDVIAENLASPWPSGLSCFINVYHHFSPWDSYFGFSRFSPICANPNMISSMIYPAPKVLVCSMPPVQPI